MGGLAYAVAHAYGHNYSGGAGFYGYRYTIESLTLMCPLLVMAWQHWTALTTRRRVAFAILAVLAVTQHAAGALYAVPRIDASAFDPWRHFLFVEAWDVGGPTRNAFGAPAVPSPSWLRSWPSGGHHQRLTSHPIVETCNPFVRWAVRLF